MLLEISEEINPERMKRWSQSKINTQETGLQTREPLRTKRDPGMKERWLRTPLWASVASSVNKD